MKEKIKKLLFEYTLNSRITTKELGKKINSSQQSAFYLLNSLKEKKIILAETTVIDALKLGYINTLVGFNYIKIDNKTREEIIQFLINTNEVVGVEESKEGFDLFVEFSTKNLAALDKLYSEIIHKFDKKLTTAFIFPIITKYQYPKKYLKNLKILKPRILFGDRTLKKISDNEKKILEELLKDSTKKIIDIAEKTKLSVKSVTKAKKDLEAKFIIKGYGAILDYNELEIQREIIFLRFTSEGMKEINKFIDYAKTHKNIVEVIKTIGSSHLVIVAEGIREINLIKEIRTHFSIQDNMIFKSLRIHKKSYLPLDFQGFNFI